MKWPDLAHWEFDGHYLGRDDCGQWFGVPAGTHLQRPGAAYDSGADAAAVAPDGLGYIATFYAPGSRVHTYVDITTPPEVEPGRIAAVDLDLDVVRLADGTVYVDDEDEFAEHQQTLHYPRQLITDALRSCDLVYQALSSGQAPYDGRAEEWLSRVRH